MNPLPSRKAWLRERLSEQRATHAAEHYFRKGGKFVAKTTYYQTFSRYGLYAGKIRENVLPEAATGGALDALCNLPTMPTHWTNEQRRHYIQYGFVVEADDYGTPDDRAQRGSPPLTLWYNGGLADNGEPVGNLQRMECERAGCGAWHMDTLDECCDGSGCKVCGSRPGDGI